MEAPAWQKAPDATQYDISHYAPNGINQLKNSETSEGDPVGFTQIALMAA